MRLDAVYVLAPKKTPPSVPTRRAFLLTGGAFAVGATLGGACGYSLGMAGGAPGVGAETELPPSGDASLDEMRRLAVKAPLEELIEKRHMFLMDVPVGAHRTDAIVWRGVERLCDALLVQPEFPDRRATARILLQVIDNCPLEDVRKRLDPKLGSLRKVR